MSKTTIDTQSNYHVQTIEQVAEHLNTNIENGLTANEVTSRHTTYGYNELSADGGPKWIKVLFGQLLDVMNWIFIALAIASYCLEDYVTGSLLMALSLLNIYLGFSQEYAAEQTLAALRNLSSPTAEVIRDGLEQSVPSRDIVPGDILLVKEGDSVGADARLIYISNLEADEALLTGESVPVTKQLVVLEQPGKKN